MLTYQSHLQSNPPFSDRQREAALAAVRRSSPYKVFGQNHQDILGALAESAAGALDMEAYRANADYDMRQQQSQRQLALAGLQQQAEAERNRRDLSTSRLQSMVGFAGSLLGGLFD